MSRLTQYDYMGHSLVQEVFIETGTYRGDTLSYAIKQGFRELHSIEYDLKNYEHSLNRFTDVSNIYIHHGSSPEILPTIINEHATTTFWLDAHYQGTRQEEQDIKYGQCPLISELEIINTVQWNKLPYILIDDANVYIKPPSEDFKREQWPDIKDIKNILPDYNITISNDIIYCLPYTS